MSDAGGGEDVVAVDLALDDEASAVLPADPDHHGLVQTRQPGTADDFPTPAPAATGTSALSAFDGTNPNGTWSLYVVDDAGDDVGTWRAGRLDIETDNTPPTGTVAINGGSAASGARAPSRWTSRRATRARRPRA